MRKIISEEQFDELPPQTQMYYLYCSKCGYFYLSSNKGKHLCGEEGTISVEEMLKREG